MRKLLNKLDLHQCELQHTHSKQNFEVEYGRGHNQPDIVTIFSPLFNAHIFVISKLKISKSKSK